MEITARELAQRLKMNEGNIKCKLSNYQLQKYVKYKTTRSPYSIILNEKSLAILEHLLIPINNTNSFKRNFKIQKFKELEKEVLNSIF